MSDSPSMREEIAPQAKPNGHGRAPADTGRVRLENV